MCRSFGHLNDLLFLDSWEELTGKYRPLKLYRCGPTDFMSWGLGLGALGFWLGKACRISVLMDLTPPGRFW